jgi:1-pyrroline-5-carboxylate dehydrogenase
VPFKHFLGNTKKFKLLTTELFGPFSIVTEYGSHQIDKVLEIFERMSHHLTAAVVSNDIHFQNKILASTVNGTTYNGIRARTTGAP